MAGGTHADTVHTPAPTQTSKNCNKNFSFPTCSTHPPRLPQGLERLVATNVVMKMFREKIEKIALDLVKLENERFSIPALKLLITCMYIGKFYYVL